ncbi:uncharacterized protein FIBRA_07325 [Fibroporia radiculosa]|uniref:Lysophospholipase n=1 Tax=Fibroporia radiculosa TaxID=599839 RepID=J4I0H7_9APHY|nr:uncharacterized protein FIBRA_07325 [Fibroporia radiculosa]CCM05117.1 predicted protein [Fibroporia radiculosa]
MKVSALVPLAALCSPLLVACQEEAAAAYAPTLGACPEGVSLIRNAGSGSRQTLSADEYVYISGREEKVLPDAWRFYLDTVTESVRDLVDMPAYVSEILDGSYGYSGYPRFGIATSGGGYRAAIFGAGVLNALDGRNTSSLKAGTGGLLQSATYLAGLSGGNLLVTSLAQANFPTFSDLIFGSSDENVNSWGGWNAEIDLLDVSTNATVDEDYLIQLVEEIVGKYEMGFPVTICDVWARTLSRHFVNGTNLEDFSNPDLTHGAGVTFSSIATVDSFVNYEQPFPIIVIDSLSPNGNASNILNQSGLAVPLTNPIYEVNAYEMGSFDPMLSAFTPTKYLGSPGNGECATGFDQLSFIQGLSSNEFNLYNTSASALQASPIGPILEVFEAIIPESGIDLTVGLVPNPFYGQSPETYIDSNETLLQLVDGGEDGEVVPFLPLLVKAREVEVIFAIDAAADTEENWADGSSIISTQDRVAFFPNSYSFPPVPPLQATFLAEGLTKRPTFFGCSSTVASGDPLVIYLANGGPPLGQPAMTNTSTDQFTYYADELDGMLSQAFDVATQGIADGTKDAEWAACLACAVVDRARRREGIARSGVCESCLDRYCWD